MPAGALHYRLALQQGDDIGVTLPRDSVRVGAPAPGALGLSDLVLGSRNANLAWVRSPDDTVLFNPLRTYRRGDEMELYYEIEGLRPAPYTVELEVRKKGSGGGIFKKIFGGSSSGDSIEVRGAGYDADRIDAPEPQARSPQARQLRPGGQRVGCGGPEGSSGPGLSGGGAIRIGRSEGNVSGRHSTDTRTLRSRPLGGSFLPTSAA